MATPKNGPTCSADGISLDGNDDYVDIDDWEWGGATSIEVYVKYDNFNGWSDRVLDFGNGASTDNVFLRNAGDTSKISWDVYHGLSWSYLQTSYWDSTWTHVVATVKGTTMKLYKNGAFAGEQIDRSEPNVLTRTDHIIGNNAGGDRAFEGTIAFVKMWHGVELSASDVKTLSFCPSGASGNPLIFCATCPVGQYSTYPDTSTCSSCPDGKTTTTDPDPSNHDSPDDCSVTCPVGTYSTGGTSCLICSAGTYSSSPGSASCSVCPAGNFNADHATSASAHDGLADCTSCSPGFKLEDAGADASKHDAADDCVACGPGFFSNSTGATGCTKCPDGQVSPAGAR